MTMTVTTANTMVRASNLYLVNKMFSSVRGDLPGVPGDDLSAVDYCSVVYRCQSDGFSTWSIT